MSVFVDVAVISILILINGFFALSELAIVSSRRERLEPMAMTGDTGAQAALEMTEDPTALLSTVQVGITLVGIVAGAFGGARLSAELAPYLAGLPGIGQYSQAISFVLVVSVITYFSVVIGELVPKRLALQNPERVASLVAPTMSVISRVAQPIVRVLALSTDGVLRLLGVDVSQTADPVTEEEIKLLIDQGAQAGVFDIAERDMVESIFRFGDRQLRSMMTPRTEIVWLDVNESSDQIRATIDESNHTQFPVCEDELDYVLGVVRSKDLLSHQWANDTIDLRLVLQPALILPETMMALRALERFKQEGAHMAILVDEFGGVEGLITLIDILEAIVGDIPTLDEMQEPPVVLREDGSLLVDGLISVDDLRAVLDVEALPDDDQYQTLGGFVIHMIGRLPHTGESFRWGGFQFEVIDMDGNRVDKVLVGRLEPT
jgi:magnesium and cobalt exporter, CNNM family